MEKIERVYFKIMQKNDYTCSTADLWKSKLTGFGPGDETELVGESTNLVHCKKILIVNRNHIFDKILHTAF